MGLINAAFMLPGFLLGLTLHEFAHAWSASLLGDDFARRQGRVSLNPFRHLSLVGTLVLLVLPIGWGKPVPINIYNFKRPRRDFLLSSLAGPLGNLVLAGLCLAAMLLTRHCYWFGPGGTAAVMLIHDLLTWAVVVNMIMAAFNLLPIPPLDGSRIWSYLIPGRRATSGRNTTWLWMGLILIMVWTGGLQPIVTVVVHTAVRIMPESDADLYADHVAEGTKAYHGKNMAEARGHVDAAVSINPHGHAALFLRARIQAAAKDHPAAVKDITAAIDLMPLARYYRHRATYFDALGREAEAEADRQMARKLGGRPTTRPTSRPTTVTAR